MGDVAETTEAFKDGLLQLTGSNWLSNLLTICLCVLATAVITHLIVRFLKRLFNREGSPLPSSSIFINLFRGLSWFICLSVILSACFGVDVSGVVTALGVGGIALSLGFQDTISNLIGGLQVSIMGIIKPGDYIQVGSNEGIVRDVTWRHTTITTPLGDVVSIPNSNINTSSLVRWPSALEARLTVCLSCDGADIERRCQQIEAAALSAMQKLGPVETPPALRLFEVNEYGFRGRLSYTNTTGQPGAVVKDAVIKAVAAYTR